MKYCLNLFVVSIFGACSFVHQPSNEDVFLKDSTKSFLTNDKKSLNIVDTIKENDIVKDSRHQNVLLRVEKEVNFSSHNSKDLFSLVIEGKGKYENSHCQFKIINSDGEEIYLHEFKSSELFPLRDDTSSITRDELVDITNDFFDSINFVQPAIKHIYDDTYTDLDSLTWNSYRNDSIIGFSYVLSDESILSILWDEKIRKVIVYSFCC